MNITKTILASAILAGLSQHVQAQENTIETITIAGTGSPISIGQVAGSVTIIDEVQIRASGALGITDLLRTVAGVNIGQTGPSGSLTELRFRGSESNHIMVLVDGVAINDIGQGGLTDFSHILTANIARIEILRGPQSAVWGSNAIAGVISITTKKSNSSALQSSASLSAGTHNTYRAAANASQQIGKFGFNVNASTHKTAGENISRDGTEKDAYRNTDISGGLNYSFKHTNKITVNARLLNFTADADGYNFATGLVSDNNAVAEGEQISLGFNWHFTPSENAIEKSIYSQLLSIQYSSQETENFTDKIFDRSSTGKKLRLLWTNRFKFANDKWINIGLESTTEDFEQRGASADNQANQNQSNDTFSFVSDGLYGLTNELSLSASYRYDNNDEFNNADSFRYGTTYAINNDWRLFVSQGKAIKNPTFVERFGFFPGSFLGNESLIPEQQNSTEAGIEGSFNNTSIQVSWFDANLDNEILGFVFDPESGQFTAQNATEKSERQGFEISGSGQIDKLSWQAQYSYLDAMEGSARELRRSRHSGSASATYTLNEYHQWYVQADYSGTKFDRFFPPFPQPSQVVSLGSYWLASANYIYNHNDRLSVNLRFSNLFNEEYEDVFGYNTEGRRALLGVRYNWQ
jgi:vitamin B12 transporter